ncbi:MAG: YihY/virulence factor BrkB family protein [Bacteroidales bacterium]
MKKRIKRIFLLLKNSAKKYKEDNPVRLAGTTAYFAVFAMAPIIIILVSVLGILLDQESIQEKIFVEIQKLIGEQGKDYIKDLVSNFKGTSRNISGTVIGIVIFLFTSTTFFTVLQRSLNYIWRIRAKPSSSFLKFLKDRLISLAFILSFGFIMLISLMVDTALTLLGDYLAELLPSVTLNLMEVINIIISFGVVTLIFAMIFKYLPDAVIKWKETWVGALITAVLFTAGKWLIGFAIGSTNIGVMYGAAGSLVIILLWIFYSSIVFFFGAEITQQYAEMYEHDILPKDHAVRIEIKEVNEEQD